MRAWAEVEAQQKGAPFGAVQASMKALRAAFGGSWEGSEAAGSGPLDGRPGTIY